MQTQWIGKMNHFRDLFPTVRETSHEFNKDIVKMIRKFMEQMKNKPIQGTITNERSK